MDILETNLSINENTLDEKLVGIVSDGASVMRGRLNGVMTKLKGDNLNIIDIHCLSHCMELGVDWKIFHSMNNAEAYCVLCMYFTTEMP